MRRALCLAAAVTCVLVAGVGAQQAGQNVPVLPVVKPAVPDSPASVLDAALKGDLYMQRQVEPTLAVSTRNPSHLIAFFNDYRAVDIPHDTGVGEGLVARIGAAFKGFLARLLGRPTGKPALPPAAAASEAWVGMARSDDGGLTWSGGFVPGSPSDGSPASLASPVKGLEAASDPVAFAAPCGYVHLAFIAFTRGGSSKLVVATYQDENASETGQSFSYRSTSVVEVGENATNGHFVDKPSIGVDVARDGSADPCAHNIYVGYSTFVGLQKNGKIQTQLTVARSTDNGQTFSLSKLNQSWNESQGSAIAVDPRPTADGGGPVYVAWRHFNSPDTIVVSKSTDFGVTFSRGEAVSAAPIEAFDQASLSTAYGAENVAFRSNAFPTIAVADNGRVFVAWQERVSLALGDGFGLPVAGGSPRIVLMRSDDGGATWKGPDGGTGRQRAVDLGDRDADQALWPAPGLGFLPQSRPSGPQVMPKLSFGGGRLYLSYYESRGLLGPADTILPADTTGPLPGYITGIDRLMDVRGALLDPVTGALLDGTATTQISRYPVRADLGILGRPERLGDIEPVNWPCSPDSVDSLGNQIPGLPACVRRVNRVGAAHSAAGTTPFMGDYIDATPIVAFVPDGLNRWRWATAAGDVPYRAFRSIWTDNRNQVPPLGGIADYPNYSPPGTGGGCINPGSRNADVFTSEVRADLVVTAPTTFTKLGAVKHAYPVFVQNTTAANRYFRFTIETGAEIASFDQFSNDPTADVIQNGIFAFSSFSAVVYVEPAATGTVKVKVQELACTPDDPATPTDESVCTASGSSGTATINLDPTNTVPVAEEFHNPLVPNPLVPNPLVPNPLVPNPLATNPLVPNPLVPNPLVPNPLVPNITASNSTLSDPKTTIFNVQYGTTSVTNGGNTTTAFTPDVKIDNPSQYDGEYVFQLVVYKTSASAGFDGCSTSNVPGFQILASVPMTSDMLNPLEPNPLVPNPPVPNPPVTNPLVPNPLVPNPLVPNATLTIAPSDSGSSTGGAAARSLSGASAQNADDGTLHAPKVPDEVHIALFAYQIVEQPTHVFNPNPAADGGDPPSVSVFSTSCNSNGTCPSDYRAPDLVVGGTPVIAPSPLAPGSRITIEGLVLTNQGNAAANSENSSYSHQAYLSANADLDAGDADLGVFATSIGVLLPDGAAALSGTTPLPIPKDTSPGLKYLIVFVDAGREVSEVNEANNTVVIPVTIPAATTTTVAVADATYDGSPHGATASVTGPGLYETLTVTYTGTGSTVYGPATTAPIDAGTYSAEATYAGTADYLGSSDSRNFTIARAASSTVVSCPAAVTYTGAALTPCTVAVTGAGGLSLTPSPSYANNVSVGTATASYTFAGDANHTGSGNSATFTIGRATAAVTLGNLTQTYTGSPLTPTATTSPAGLAIGWTGVPQTNAGSYPVTATVNDANYQGSAAGTFTILMPPLPRLTASADPSTLLWSPNKLLIPVTVSGQVSGTDVTVAYTVRDEYGTVQPRGTATIANELYSFVVKLEAYRYGSDANGRLYTITVTATDRFGRQTSAVTTVTVPHDQK
jgi:hypothetical protein